MQSPGRFQGVRQERGMGSPAVVPDPTRVPVVADTSYQGEESLTVSPRFPRTEFEADGELGYQGEGTGWKDRAFGQAS